jgi:hypothetical protein
MQLFDGEWRRRFQEWERRGWYRVSMSVDEARWLSTLLEHIPCDTPWTGETAHLVDLIGRFSEDLEVVERQRMKPLVMGWGVLVPLSPREASWMVDAITKAACAQPVHVATGIDIGSLIDRLGDGLRWAQESDDHKVDVQTPGTLRRPRPRS